MVYLPSGFDEFPRLDADKAFVAGE
jgi:hypothetical protein